MKREDRWPGIHAARGGNGSARRGTVTTGSRTRRNIGAGAWPHAAPYLRTDRANSPAWADPVGDETHSTSDPRAFPNLRESPNVARLKDIRKSFDESS